MPLIRTWMRQHRIGDVIPFRKDEIDRWPRGFRMRRFDRQLYRRRNAIERTIGLLKERRRLVTRFEKLAVSFMAMVDLAFAEIYLRELFRDRA
jgi:transposase